MKAKLAAKLREYFMAAQATGLCYQFRNDEGMSSLLKKYAFEWPHSIKNYDGSDLDAYFVPAEIGNTSSNDSVTAYCRYSDMRRQTARVELANFIVKQIAREQKKKFVPISFDNSPPIK